MDFKKYKTLPFDVKEQIRNVTDTWLKCIGESVIGIYVGGVLDDKNILHWWISM